MAGEGAQGRPQSHNIEVGTRLQALALAEYGIKPKDVRALTRQSEATISRLRKKAYDRGYDPTVTKLLFLKYATDRERSGRPRTGANQNGNDAVDGAEPMRFAIEN